MKPKQVFQYCLIILIIVLLDSCKKFVEIPPPSSQLTTVTVFEDDATASAALTSIYSQMVIELTGLPYTIALYTGLASDELKYNSTAPGLLKIYSNSISSIDNGPTDAIWNKGYNFIYQANALIEGCQQSKKLDEIVKKQLIAEGIFIRSWWCFYLHNLFGDIPLFISTDYSINSKAFKKSKEDIYRQLILDLKDAENNLSENYVDGSSIKATNDRFRPNKYCANALLSRVYLYSEDFKSAEEESSKIIDNIGQYSLTDLNSIFLINSKEAIWQLMMPSPFGSNGNSMEGQNFILTSKPGSSTQNNVSTISDQLLNSFEPNDQRKVDWIGVYKDVSDTQNISYYYPKKFKLKDVETPTEYSTPLRVSEQFLIRSEARVKLGNLSGAKNDLNEVRHRAGLGDTPANDEPSILNAILHERQVELFSEWGHRWFDIKRTNNVDAIMEIATLTKGGTWQSYQQLWPIPLQTIENDHNLIQNPGYN